MPSWPISLPQVPLLAGFSVAAPDTVIRSQPDVGPTMTRQRVTDNVRPITISLILTSVALKDVLFEFYRVDCKGGALTVTWATLSTHTGGGTGTFLFTAPPSFTPLGLGRWRVEMQMERKP